MAVLGGQTDGTAAGARGKGGARQRLRTEEADKWVVSSPGSHVIRRDHRRDLHAAGPNKPATLADNGNEKNKTSIGSRHEPTRTLG
jgi:hypothetical protein